MIQIAAEKYSLSDKLKEEIPRREASGLQSLVRDIMAETQMWRPKYPHEPQPQHPYRREPQFHPLRTNLDPNAPSFELPKKPDPVVIEKDPFVNKYQTEYRGNPMWESTQTQVS